MFSNWAGLSGWKTTDDPTGVLNGRCLIAEGGLETPSFEILTQEISTSTAFDIDHYEITTNYAFQDDWQFQSGLFYLLSRASYSGSNLVHCYAAGFDIQRGTITIAKFNSVEWEFLSVAKMTSNSPVITRSKLHEIKFRTFGTNTTTLELEIDGNVILTHADIGTSQITSGFPGILVQRGTLYIDSFSVIRYTVDAKSPSEWTPALLGLNLSLWLSDSNKTVVLDAESKKRISDWDDISGNSNDGSTSVYQRPTYVEEWKNNLEGGNWEHQVGDQRTSSFFTGPANSGAGTNQGFYVAKTMNNTTPFTVSMWVYLTSSTSTQDLFSFLDSASWDKVFWCKISSLQMYIHADCTTTSSQNDAFYTGITTTGILNTWANLTFTYTGTQSNLVNDLNLKVYLNGVPITFSSQNDRNPGGGSPVGLQAPGTHFLVNAVDGDSTGGYGIDNGFIADVSFWNQVLTGTEVTELYNSGNYLDLSLHSAYANLTDWWKFEETFGGPRKRKNAVLFPDLKGTSNLQAPDWWTFMREVPTEGSSPQQGTGSSYYFGGNYIPLFEKDAPTGGQGSLYWGQPAAAAPVGSYRYLSFTDGTSLIAEGTAITIAFWIKIESGTLENKRLFTAQNESGTDIFYVETDQNGPSHPELRVYARSDSYTATPGDIYCQLEYDDNAFTSPGWHHVVITWDGVAASLDTAVAVYVDGVVQSTSSTTINNPALAVNYALGSVTEFIFFSDSKLSISKEIRHNIYSIVVFDAVLDAPAVTELYNTGSVLDPATHSDSGNLIHFWRTVEKDGKNRNLEESFSIGNERTPADFLFQINGSLKDTTSSEIWNAQYQTFSVAQIGPGGGGAFPSLLKVAASSTLDLDSSGASIFAIMYSNIQLVGGDEQIVLQKSNSYGILVKENQLRFVNADAEYGSPSTVKFGTNALFLAEVITNDGIYINGTSSQSLTGISTTADNSYILSIGATKDATLSTTLLGGLGEILVYKGELSTGERQKVEGYLAHKWGLNAVLPSTHPYSSQTPKVGD